MKVINPEYITVQGSQAILLLTDVKIRIFGQFSGKNKELQWEIWVLWKKQCELRGYRAKIVAIFGEMHNFPKSPGKIVIFAPMLQEGIIWKNIHPWKFSIYCSLNIFQIGANCKKIDVTNQTECPITGVYIFLGFKIFLNKIIWD